MTFEQPGSEVSIAPDGEAAVLSAGEREFMLLNLSFTSAWLTKYGNRPDVNPEHKRYYQHSYGQSVEALGLGEDPLAVEEALHSFREERFGSAA